MLVVLAAVLVRQMKSKRRKLKVLFVVLQSLLILGILIPLRFLLKSLN